MQEQSPRHVASALRTVFSLILIGLAVWVFLNRQFIIDEIAIRQFTPTAEVASFAETTKMTSQAKRYYLASKPEVNEADTLNVNCQSHGEQSIILGCYASKRIYLYNVSDPRLAGVKEVTAAHEMLHAAYERLSRSEKERIDGLLMKQVQSITEERILKLIELYEKSEPTQLMNEMHSILATEAVSLSPELEDYFSRYFTDRSNVVALSKQYEEVFAQIEASQKELSQTLESLNNEIKQLSDSLNASIEQLNRDIAVFNARASNGGFSSQAEFNAERARLSARQSNLSADRSQINSLIEEFNRTRSELMALNSQASSLNNSLDSTPDDIPAFN